jgi:hypothetical protein
MGDRSKIEGLFSTSTLTNRNNPLPCTIPWIIFLTSPQAINLETGRKGKVVAINNIPNLNCNRDRGFDPNDKGTKTIEAHALYHLVKKEERPPEDRVKNILMGMVETKRNAKLDVRLCQREF